MSEANEVERVVMWVDATHELPKSGKNVLAIQQTGYKDNRVTIVAHWVDKFTEEAGEEEFADYCEEKDEYFLPPGWYENQWNWGDYAAIKVHDDKDITHWMPLPDKPALDT